MPKESFKILKDLWTMIIEAPIPRTYKAVLLTLDFLAIVIYSFWFLLLLEKAADIAGKMVGLP